MNEQHYQKLENLFNIAAVQKNYPGIRIQISHERCTITYPVASTHFHGGDALHGAVYFKLLDDAAFFAVSSSVLDCFVLTGTYTIKLLKPITSGVIKSVGTVTGGRGRVYTASAELFLESGELAATGEGTFVKTSKPLESLPGYALPV